MPASASMAPHCPVLHFGVLSKNSSTTQAWKPQAWVCRRIQTVQMDIPTLRLLQQPLWAGRGSCKELPFPCMQRAGRAMLMTCWHLNLNSSHCQGPTPECRGGAGSALGPACLASMTLFPFTAGTRRKKKAYKMCCCKQMLVNYRKNSEPNQAAEARLPDPCPGTVCGQGSALAVGRKAGTIAGLGSRCPGFFH